MGIVRLILALAVMFVHAPSASRPPLASHFISGIPAVQCFYIISGFYMALVLSDRYTSIKNFYFNRFLRLYPTYWCVLAMTVAFSIWMQDSTFIEKILHAEALGWDGKFLMLLSSLTIWGSDVMHFLAPGPAGLEFTRNFHDHSPALWWFHPIPPAWSLPLEMMFYALAPFIVKSKSRLVMIFLTSLAMRWWVYSFVGSNDPWSFRFFPLELAFFCLGSLAFHGYGLLRTSPLAKKIGLFALIILIMCLVQGDRLGLVQIYVCMLLALPFVFLATKDHMVDRWLGELSYPFYLSHLTCLKLFPDNILLAIASTFAVSVSINTFIQPVVEAQFKRPPKPLFSLTAA
jgi:peptidoglycan/LPS O-acetylase OafA/YrhL